MSFRKILALSVTLPALFALTYAQEPKVDRGDKLGSFQERTQDGRRHGRMRRHRLGGLSYLDLTEEQRQQQRAIVQRHLVNTKTQREELFKLREKRIEGTFTAEDEARAQALRQEIRNSMKGIRTEIEAVLTDEQRAKLEQFRTERKARREELRQRRRELRERRETDLR